jgi:hypothetical protein
MRRRNFAADARILSTITVNDLKSAAKETDQNMRISNPAVRLLHQHVHATGGRIMGSDATRISLRSQIWATSICFNAASVWITVNPDDLHNPIAQVFIGEEIDLDNFVKTAGPDRDRRSKSIARDPYAAARFFHFMIRTMISVLFHINVNSVGRIQSGKGEVQAYFGTVECQGRGTLHLHMLIWLKGSPPDEEMANLLMSPVFQAKVRRFIKANFCAYLPELETAEDVKGIRSDPEVGYNRPPKLDSSTYKEDLESLTRSVVRTKQVHTCSAAACLRSDNVASSG